MTDIVQHPLPKKTKNYLSAGRRARKIARTNRAPINKGILVNPGENIQQAVNITNKNGGGLVTLVSGTHSVDYDITIPSNVFLEGEGRSVSIIDFNDSSKSIKITGTSTISSVTIASLQILDSGTDGIVINGATDIVIDDVTVTSCVGDGIELTANADNVSIRDCLITNNSGYGVNIVNANCNNNILSNNTFVSNTLGDVDNNGSGTIINTGNIGVMAKARAYRSTTNQSINNSTQTKVQLNAESYDDGGDFDSTTNYRFTAPISGTYIIICKAEMEALADGAGFIISIYKNGVLIGEVARVTTGAAGNAGANGSDVMDLAKGDYVEMYAYHTHGSARNIVFGETLTYMSIHRIS